MLDLVGCNPDYISSGEFLYKFLSELPAKIGMNKMSQPHLDLYYGIHSDWEGWSGTVHIQESHITFHSFNWGYLCLDIFSCKDFDVESAIDMIKSIVEADKHQPKFKDPNAKIVQEAIQFLKDKKSEVHYISRGLNFPPSLK